MAAHPVHAGRSSPAVSVRFSPTRRMGDSPSTCTLLSSQGSALALSHTAYLEAHRRAPWNLTRPTFCCSHRHRSDPVTRTLSQAVAWSGPVLTTPKRPKRLVPVDMTSCGGNNFPRCLAVLLWKKLVPPVSRVKTLDRGFPHEPLCGCWPALDASPKVDIVLVTTEPLETLSRPFSGRLSLALWSCCIRFGALSLPVLLTWKRLAQGEEVMQALVA